MKVYIDGENLRHRLVDVLLQEKLVPNREVQFNFNVPALLTTVLHEQPEQVIYYTTRIRRPKFTIPQKLAKRIQAIQESSRRWIAELTNQGLRIVKAGHLKVRETSVCTHCGKKTLVLQEKGVDVRMATDIVMAAVQDKLKHVVVLSSDADMIPALQVARRVGTKVSYLGFSEELNRAIAAIADETLTYTRKSIVDIYKAGKSHE